MRHCVIIPFYGRPGQTTRCLAALWDQRAEGTEFLLMDDGSPSPLAHPLLSESRVHLIRHPQNQGIAAARNSAIHWCRRRLFPVIIMVDSDCEPAPDLIATHMHLLELHPRATCIAGAVVGRGRGIFAQLDATLSWPRTIPFGDLRCTTDAFYHLSTSNVAMRLSLLPERDFVFDERLHTGEDCLLSRELRRKGAVLLFSPAPLVFHQDREHLRAVVKHHYAWGHHQYFIQLGGDFSPRVFDPFYRGVFIGGLAASLPLYAWSGALLNLWPWMRVSPARAIWLPAAVLVWFAKGVAVIRTAHDPEKYLRTPRRRIEYDEARDPRGQPLRPRDRLSNPS